MNIPLPTGTVTFLFTDIEGSTRLWQEMPEAMSISHARHDAILRAAIESNHGTIFQVVGDSFSAAFYNASDGLAAALAAQRGLQAEPWGETGAIRVRMGLHTGEVQSYGDGSNQYLEGYTSLASAQRVMSVAHGGQVLFSHTIYDLLQNDLPEQVSLRDMGEHRLKDLRSPIHLYQLIAPDLPQAFPVLQSLNTLPNNLPEQLTHFVGREKELAEVERLLVETRLLTITGPGGTGKTRLELQVAADLLEKFPQGAWLVELAPVTDPQLVLESVANVLNVGETSGRRLQDVLVDYLRYKSLLLVLDNCEHLIQACAQVADTLLHACSKLKILASSREALGIAGEVAFPVPSLSLPPASLKPGGDSLSDLEKSEAVRLFVERAQAVMPGFCLEKDNGSAVAQICRRLDGIPLAIELAAARIKVLTPAQIASRLDNRFRLLTGGSRTALPRHQTLKALIDWSWTLLSDPEKTLLRRLAVFTGGFTLEAAEMVCADLDPVPTGDALVSPFEILDLLEGLVNKSLIVAGEEPGGVRYRLSETIRQYALDQLLPSGEITSLRDRQLEYFTRLAEEAEPYLQGAEMIEWMDRLERDTDNLRAALEWGLDRCHPAVLTLAKSLIYYWMSSGLGTEGMRWLGAAAACLPPTEPAESGPTSDSVTLQRQAVLQRQASQAYFMSGAAMLAINLGQSQPAIQLGMEGERWARLSGDQHALGFALAITTLSKVTLEGITPQVKADVEESLALARQFGDIWLQCTVLGLSARLAFWSGDLAGIHRYLYEQDRLARQTGNPWAIAINTFDTIMTGQQKGDLTEIRQLTEEGIRLFARLKNNLFITAWRSELAHILRKQGELEEAQAIYRETIPKWLELGNQGAIAHDLECLADLAIKYSQPERAARLLGAAQALRTLVHEEMAPNERPEYDALLSELQLRLDPAALQSAWSSGEAMGLEQAIADALGEGKTDQSVLDKD